MFCPRINGECRPDCIKWDFKLGKCQDVISAELSIKAGQMMEYAMQMQQISWRLEMKRIMTDPTIPSDVKEAIQEAEDIATVEKLLRDIGLLD